MVVESCSKTSDVKVPGRRRRESKTSVGIELDFGKGSRHADVRSVADILERDQQRRRSRGWEMESRGRKEGR